MWVSFCSFLAYWSCSCTSWPVTAMKNEPRLLAGGGGAVRQRSVSAPQAGSRSEEHTSELQSLAYLVCRLLLEKKKRCQSYYEQLPERTEPLHVQWRTTI